MVYIHGGTFTTGGADEFHWKVRSKIKDQFLKINSRAQFVISSRGALSLLRYNIAWASTVSSLHLLSNFRRIEGCMIRYAVFSSIIR